MTPVVKKISFYPFIYYPLPKQGHYAVARYNIIKHKWIVLERRFGLKTEIEDYVHELNMESGRIEEEFIVGYKE